MVTLESQSSAAPKGSERQEIYFAEFRETGMIGGHFASYLRRECKVTPTQETVLSLDRGVCSGSARLPARGSRCLI
jgi:hypothetical protein